MQRSEIDVTNMLQKRFKTMKIRKKTRLMNVLKNI